MIIFVRDVIFTDGFFSVECFRSKTSVTGGTDESEREDDTSSEGR